MTAKMIVSTCSKGGVGKTTVATTVAHGLARMDARVLLVDLDRQGQCSISLGLSPEMCVFRYLVTDEPLENVVRSAGRESLMLMPGDRTTEMVKVGQHQFRQLFDGVKAAFDYVVFDTSAHGDLRMFASAMGDTLIVPCGLDSLELDSVRLTMDDLDGWNPNAQKIVLPNQYDKRLAIHQSSLEALGEAFKGYCMSPVLRRVEVAELPSAGETLWEYAPNSDVVPVFEELLDWIVRDESEVLGLEVA
ncbi:ParA family protein [Chloroflexi bacterium TSY]|nr:ParA family protein [Chloroflexi bacterium TSY]